MLLRASHDLSQPPAAPTPTDAPQAQQAPSVFHPLDLRRAAVRRHADTIVARAAFLAPDDRALIYAVFRDLIPVAAIARAAGVSAPHMRRRVRRLLLRLFTPRYIWVISARNAWTPERRRIADAAFLQGLSQRAIAKRLQISLPRVRAALCALRVLEESAHHAPQPLPLNLIEPK